MRSAKSLKAKGKYLQNVVLQKIIDLFPYLKKKDIRSARDSEPGSDIKLLSLTARKLFPYDVECKNREEYKTIYKHFKQCQNHGKLEPLLVIKMNRETPLAIIDIDHLFSLLEKSDKWTQKEYSEGTIRSGTRSKEKRKEWIRL